MTDEQLELLSGIERAATPGPWNTRRPIAPHYGREYGSPDHSLYEEGGTGGDPICMFMWVADTPGPDPKMSANSRFIEVARTALPSLIEEVKRLRKEVEEQSQIIHDLKEEHSAYMVTIATWHDAQYESVLETYTSCSLSEVKQWTHKMWANYYYDPDTYATIKCGDKVILVGSRNNRGELTWEKPN